MDFSKYKFRFKELSKYEDEIRINTDISDHDRACQFLSIIDETEDYSLLGDDELLGILSEFSVSNMDISNDINSIEDFFDLLDVMLDRYKEELRTAIRPALESISKINVVASAEIIANSLKEFSRRIQEITKPVFDAFKGIDFKPYFEWVDDYILIASEYEWVIYDDMEISDLRKIVDIHNSSEYTQNQKEKLVNDLYLSYLTYEVVESILTDMISRDRLNSMQHILEEIRFAFHKKKFYLCCSTLIPLIEGAVFDTFDGEFYCRQDRFLNRIKSLSDSKISSIVLNIFESKLFSNFLYGQELESNISRHAIMHGFDRKYGNMVTFYKLLLLFSTLIDWLDTSVDNI
ncbi:hypothetical protein QA584_26645 [Anaerocolumna sp. AGMB13025]|uniref:hypothetical protein n=1 Tax=Anaerocolumna sp. AGMB13025 TaxID=3039116 RepID=UPI00241CBB76|nr:hypothetical protein [Anaerocolumna sp. AGMB13025]WFR57146.1 hypothetical protein QA584_26645 [Anaerocolumna sp. AGMB13025]